MIKLKVTSDGLDDLIDFVEGVRERASNLLPFAHRVAEIIAVDNMQARMLGVDREGQPLEPIVEATWDLHEAFHGYSRGPGPPMAAREGQSSTIAGFETEVLELDGARRVLVTGDWPGLPWLQYHERGYTSRWGRQVPARDIAGLRPQAWWKIADEFTVWTDSLLAGVNY